MNDSADVLFIDSHSECDRCNDTGQGPIHEFVLNLFPFFVFHPGMIRIRIYVVCTKKIRDVFSRFLQGNIYNSRSFGVFTDSLKHAVLFFRCGYWRYLQKEILAIKAGNKYMVFKNIEFSAHVVNYPLSSGRGKQQRLLNFEFLLIIRQFQIFRSKIMPPLRDAMRFVNNQQGNVHLFQVGAKSFIFKPFDRNH